MGTDMGEGKKGEEGEVVAEVEVGAREEGGKCTFKWGRHASQSTVRELVKSTILEQDPLLG